MTCSFSKDFSSSGYTSVENGFIFEYLPLSKGNAAKVYLYGLFLCQNPTYDQSLKEIADTLKTTEEDVLDCFTFWEDFGLLSVVSKDPLSVQYLPVKSAYSHKPLKYKAEKYTDFTKSLQSMLPSRMISTGEYTEYFNVMETYGIKPDAMIMIIKYCVDRKGQEIGYRYVSKVAKDFGTRGITTVEKVEKELSSYILRTSEIEKILKALSIKRQPEIDDLNLYKKWTQELSFETDNIVYAAKKIKKGSMNKLDEFLMELYSIKSFGQTEIEEYMSKKEQLFDLAVKINKALSVYVEVIDTVIDTYLNKWISYGFDDETLLFIAGRCFKTGKNTLQDMDALVEKLRSEGFISLSSVSDCFEQEIIIDAFIEKLLQTAGINRRPTPWDRQNVTVWKTWNFTEDMILEAAKLASGKSSPIAYMNGILSNWKNDGTFTPDLIKERADGKVDSAREYNLEYKRRRAVATAKAQKNYETAMEIEGFRDVYGRLNGIEKDLAFAELSGNETALKQFESEKAELTSKALILLQKAGLTLEDLTPKYACEKCKDTGYVGTNRCDCFDKK